MAISRQQLWDYLTLARVSNTPTLATNVLVGSVYALGDSPGAVRIMALTAPFVLLYAAGMVMNDFFDLAADRIEHPQRPYAAGRVTRREMQIMIAVLIGLAWGMLAWTTLSAFLSGVLLTALIVLYNRWHKDNPCSPLLMASCRLLVYVTALLACSAMQPGIDAAVPLVSPVAAIIGYIAGVTAVAAGESHPEWQRRWPVLLLYSPLLLTNWWDHGTWAIVAAILFISCITASNVLAVRHDGIGSAVGGYIAAIPLLDALLLGEHLTATLLVIMVTCAATTKLAQRVIPGI